ncbi:MAG: dephospho-CoA kinase, partial [Planctomycetes bacterium]|nr:dephospho-CoA kinase [Planctomycetota bacterium]
MIPIIGIVGGIGSGKSLVAQAMQQLGGHLVAADAIGHDALRQPEIIAKVVARWGDAILDPQGLPDRQKIGQIVFSNREELTALEAMVFPFIEKHIAQEIESARKRTDATFIILDAAVMLEAGWHRHCDKIVFVDAPRDVRLARLKQKRGWDEDELARREKAQLPIDEKMARADLVIVNDAGPEKIRAQVKD